MFSHIAVENEDLLSPEELGVSKLEKLYSILIVSDHLNCRPLQVELRKLDGLFLGGRDAELINLHKAFYEVSHERQIVFAKLDLNVRSKFLLL